MHIKVWMNMWTFQPPFTPQTSCLWGLTGKEITMRKRSPLNVASQGGASGKEPAWQGRRRDADSAFQLGRSPGGGHGNPLQHSCLKNPMDRGAWRATVHRVAKTRTAHTAVLGGNIVSEPVSFCFHGWKQHGFFHLELRSSLFGLE